jgi:sulfoxide reductase heme-binding subunit YedZ
MATKIYRRISKIIIFILSLIPAGWLVYAIYSDTLFGTKFMTADPIQKLDRELGDWALIFIILSLGIRPVATLLKKNKLLAYRRMIGLFAFFYVCLHLISYIGLNLQFDFNELIKDIYKRNFITVGVIAFIFLIPLAITSNKFMLKWIGGHNWKKLHMLIYPIALLGVFHFFMMVRADFSKPLIYLFIILILFGYRIWIKYKKFA